MDICTAVKSNFKLSYFVVGCSCFEVNLFVVRGEIANRNVSKCSSKIEVHDFESPPYSITTEVVHVAVTKKYAKLSGDLNAQIKGPCKLCLSSLPL